jgi:mono/diheme cytochrome c family protein/uncharacterized membrane protein
VKCHGSDGKGKRGAAVPDFTAASWQGRQKDTQLLASILEGRGDEMPAWRSKISREQARGLVAHIRAFAPTRPKEATSGSFNERYRRLQKEMAELQKQFRAPSKRGRGDPPAPRAASTPAAGRLYRKHCVRCHGTDGKGKLARRRLKVPDFTAASWQARRSDAQLLASILDGKGDEMPGWRGKISKEQARGLVAHLRAFAAAGEKEDEPAGAEEATGFSSKLTHWLGTFHPPAVHFPIALLTAAAVAEVLRLCTGKPSFDAASRYCVWFGTLTAVVAGVLGWFAGGFQPGEDSRVLTTHRWLGTATVACAAVLLVLCEVSSRSERRQMRWWFRATLLIVALLIPVTGFFGGAVVFGLDHLSWPP